VLRRVVIMDSIKCPKCNQTSTPEFWDNNTKEQAGISDSEHFISSSAPAKDHDEVESYFNCPICNEEVPGAKLVKEQ
jgi:transcription elongation factor Elf1